MTTVQLFDAVEASQQILSGETEPTPEVLVHILTEASDQYHNGDGESFLSDAQYDELEKMLKSIDPKNLFLSTVGSDVRGGKIDLPYPMGSLDQCYEGETIEWVRKNGWENEDFVISDKQDGTSALNVHAAGKLKIAYSRGNGFQGADITRHMSRIKCCPTTAKGNVAVRLEVIMEEAVFQAQKAQAEAEGGRVYKNSRNYVAGRMNASESPDLFYNTVKLVATSIVDPKMGKQEQFKLLEDMGYEVTPYVVVKGHQLTDDFLTALLNKRRKESPTPLDGIVIDLDNADLRAALRRNSSSINPMYSRKFKVGGADNVAIATVKKVHWNPSKAGYLKPRVEIDPVDLVGVTITYATGFNAKFIRDNIIGPGAKIQITRSGDVIPFIQKVVEIAPLGAQMPDVTEFGLMGWTEGDVDLVMLNPENNRQVQLEVINAIFGVTGLDVPHLREGSIEKLYDAGLKTPVDIILADEATLKAAAGDSAGTKIYNGLKLKLGNVELGILAGATSLLGRGIGRRKMTKVCDAFPNERILEGTITVQEIAALEGFERKTAQTIVDNLPKFLDFLKAIDGHYTLVAPKEKVTGGDLEGVTVVFTGIRDKDLEAKIEARSGRIGSSVNKDTTYLVAKDPTGNSSKLVKARQLIGEDNVISITKAKELWG
jgi:NAD-dependent DNA ligase